MELEDYESLLKNLLPRGPAWDGEDPLLLGLAPSLHRVHQRGDDLMIEIDPRTTQELIDRYERLTGLPDACAPDGAQTLAQRQQRLDAKINIMGGISKDFYLAQLYALGYEGATITQFETDVFRCTSTCMDSLYSDEWRFWWQVNMPNTTQVTTMTCMSSCTESLKAWGDTVAECVINKLCPSHTYVTFNYPE
ncbi:YmfQ family protein [Serratia sp. UGAL515B_01]|uniref:YmfQ family protein n=1 Tax=Serratia sp. UGAL515B_01 TaxID=2986763 RepID=UPI002955CA5D|nr:YmfQ family protein [Serratia sp. UGAL515B_01]WON77845.1 YmfQ family protein [Serratia sp. UGAL515B_01]